MAVQEGRTEKWCSLSFFECPVELREPWEEITRSKKKKNKKKQRWQESHTNKPEEHIQGSSVGFRWLRIQFRQIPTKRVQNLAVAFVAWMAFSRPRCKAYQITRAEGQIDVLMGTALRWHRRKLDRAGQRPWCCLLRHLKVWGGRNSARLSILWGVSLS